MICSKTTKGYLGEGIPIYLKEVVDTFLSMNKFIIQHFACATSFKTPLS